MKPPSQQPQRRPPQTAKNACSGVHRPARHVMPGLASVVARNFRAPRPMRITTRAVSEDTKLTSDVVQTSLFHDIYDRLELLERRVEEHRESVREWRTDIAERRIA